MVRLICVPYHLGREGVGMGAGPDRMLAAGAEALVRGQGHSVVVDRVALPGRFKHEIGAYFALQDAVARHVRRAVRQGDFPFVLGGNCGCVLGSAAGIGLGEHGGVIWFDAHGDMNTPETSASGFLDGMSMAVLTGQCWATLATLVTAVRGIGDQTPVKSVSLTSYNPSWDDDGRALTAGLRLLESLAGLAVTR